MKKAKVRKVEVFVGTRKGGFLLRSLSHLVSFVRWERRSRRKVRGDAEPWLAHCPGAGL